MGNGVERHVRVDASKHRDTPVNWTMCVPVAAQSNRLPHGGRLLRDTIAQRKTAGRAPRRLSAGPALRGTAIRYDGTVVLSALRGNGPGIEARAR